VHHKSSPLPALQLDWGFVAFALLARAFAPLQCVTSQCFIADVLQLHKTAHTAGKAALAAVCTIENVLQHVCQNCRLIAGQKSTNQPAFKPKHSIDMHIDHTAYGGDTNRRLLLQATSKRSIHQG
jgi:hypothetical protein